MGKAGFAVDKAPDRDLLIESFKSRIPLVFPLEPAGKTEGFGLSTFYISVVITTLKEHGDDLLWEGFREEGGSPPAMVKDWQSAVGYIYLKAAKGIVVLVPPPSIPPLLRDIIRNEPWTRVLLEEFPSFF